MNDIGRMFGTATLLAVVCLISPATAYEIQTHADITGAAVAQSSLVQRKGRDIGLRGDEEFPNVAGDLRSAYELFEDGARWEDGRGVLHPTTLARPAHHFFDPVHDRPLSTYPINLISEKSPDWALEDKEDFSNQDNSYKDARAFFYDAQTKPTKQERDRAWGQLFQSLGQVIHHTQDMAQPQHVRDDVHGDAWVALGVTLVTGAIAAARAHNPSFYESWTNDEKVRPYLPYSAPYETVNRFTKPREFWHDIHGRGLAQFTNWNFLSDGTNFGSGTGYNFPLRNPDLKTEMDIRQLCAEAQPACGNLRGTITLLGTWVEDRYTGQTALNPYASSYSAFDKHLERRGFNAVYSLNRFNFALAHAFLIPRAVHYSAGLIDYFFRGELTVKGAKPHGVFALVDQRPPFPGASQGFRRIKASLLNETPPIIDATGGVVAQDMSQGKLIAVAKFYRDDCFDFTDGSSGAYLVPPMGYAPCRSSNEEIIISNEIDIGMGGITIPSSGEPIQITFEFPNEVPINATDLSMQFIYRGVLGDESDAVVVKSIDLSEPTPIQVSNDRDWRFDSDGNAIRVENPETLTDVILVFADGASVPLWPLSGFSRSRAIHPGQHAGVWALVDINAPPRYAAALCDTCGATLYPLEPYRVESDGSSQAFRSTSVYNIRGMWGVNGISFYNNFPEKCAGKSIAACWTDNFSPYDPVGPATGMDIYWGYGP